MKHSYEYFCKHDIPHKKAGKLIVARNETEVKRLLELFERGQKNNVPNLELVEKDCIHKYEAKCKVRIFSKMINVRIILIYIQVLYICTIFVQTGLKI